MGCLIRKGTSSEGYEIVRLSFLCYSESLSGLLCVHVHCPKNSDLAVLNLRKRATKEKKCASKIKQQQKEKKQKTNPSFECSQS